LQLVALNCTKLQLVALRLVKVGDSNTTQDTISPSRP
jgi:hypothetical protein